MLSEIDKFLRPDSGSLRRLPDVLSKQAESAAFEAVWQTIKSWDINVPESYEGYCGATGSHVAAILNALEEDRISLTRATETPDED